MNVQKSRDLRYLRKILTDIEIKQVQGGEDPDAALWSFWACKEAAFKVIKKMSGDAAFVPRRWSVSYRSSSSATDSSADIFSIPSEPHTSISGVVKITGRQDIPFQLFLTPSYVHCVAADDGDTLASAAWQVSLLPDGQTDLEKKPSLFLRALLVERLASVLDCRPGSVEIQRQEKDGDLLPPRVYVSGLPAAGVDISLSHDGSLVAYAIHIRSAI